MLQKSLNTERTHGGRQDAYTREKQHHWCELRKHVAIAGVGRYTDGTVLYILVCILNFLLNFLKTLSMIPPPNYFHKFASHTPDSTFWEGGSSGQHPTSRCTREARGQHSPFGCLWPRYAHSEGFPKTEMTNVYYHLLFLRWIASFLVVLYMFFVFWVLITCYKCCKYFIQARCLFLMSMKSNLSIPPVDTKYHFPMLHL